MSEAPSAQTTFKIGGQDIVLDNSRLAFNEISLNNFM